MRRPPTEEVAADHEQGRNQEQQSGPAAEKPKCTCHAAAIPRPHHGVGNGR
jgi:hypothetical protein